MEKTRSAVVEDKISTYYSRIILNSFSNPLFSKLCQHNPSRPNCGCVVDGGNAMAAI